MKMRALRGEHRVTLMLAVCAALLLGGVNVLWPDAFAAFLAIGGVSGALVVLYEVRLTKRIAQAEFIRDLQSGFTSDANICELWRMLLLKQEITPRDRPLVSSYLTFFETLHLLLARGALEMSLIDDLFRNRFFTAIGDRGILDTALVSQAGAFANIHHLVEDWHDYLLDNEIVIHPGYYAYIQAFIEAKGYEIALLRKRDLPRLKALQDQVLVDLSDSGWLRANTDQMLEECLTDHRTLGVRYGRELVAAGILYDGGRGDESIKRYFSSHDAALDRSTNLKLVMVREEHRKEGLARTLVELLEHQATDQSKTEILCTVHPANKPSRSLFKRLGYRRIGKVTTPYGERLVYGRRLPSPNRRWAR